MLIAFLVGFICGVLLLLGILYIFIVDPWAPPTDQPQPPIEQFRPAQIPEELRTFLKSGEDGQGISKWESCNSISLLLHMLFQEHKDTRALRRWVHKRLQMEMNDITTRSAAGRLIQEIRIRELSLGTKFMTINSIRVESVEMADDKNTFDKIVFILDIDYSGGFETSIDVSTIIAKKASLSVKITKLTGMVRVILSRQPYHHWTFSFVSQPIFETDINSQIQGHQLKRLIPIIKEAIRRSLQRKHVWPNYKIRYRPFFPNPIFQASPPINSFTHIKMEGGIEVTVLQCSRLKNALLLDDKNKNYEVYCTVSIESRPIVQNEEQGHVVNVLLTFSRYDVSSPIGLVFDKNVAATGNNTNRAVKVCTVEDNSLADKAAFKPGDVLVAINNVPIRSERQATRFLQSTTGDLTVLVERSLDDIDEEESKEAAEIVVSTVRDIDGTGSVNDTADSTSLISNNSVANDRDSLKDDDKTIGGIPAKDGKINATALAARRRHSVSNLESSVIDTNTESVASSIFGLDAHKFDKPPSVSVQRAESARVPQLLISQPSFDLRRTQSESHLDAKVIDAVLSSSADFGMENSVEDEIKMLLVGDLNRSASAGHNLDPQLLGVVKREDKDKTLTQADASKGLALIASQTGSVASLSSMISNRTDTGTEDGGDDEEAHLDRKRSASTRKAKIQATFAAGKKKVLDLMPQKRKNTDASDLNGESIEIGADAGSLYDTDTNRDPSIGRSPMAVVGKRKESPSDEKKEKKRLKKKLSESPKIRRAAGSAQKDQSPMTTIKARTTKSVQFQKFQDVMWGQSLHFEFDSPPESTTRTVIRYLNVTVHAKEVKSAGTPTTSATNVPNATPSTPDSIASSSTNTDNSVPTNISADSKPILLGSVSLFVPQLIDDCRLTLSNCHREVYQLKQPNTSSPPQTSPDDPMLAEFARHAGYDPRLCFGDITLGFRYFPNGFPVDKAINSGDESEDELNRIHNSKDVASPTRPFSPPALSPASHDWKLWYGKNSTTCAMCRGKIWLRNASSCSRCLVICHNKCVVKANSGGIACTPQQHLTPPSNLQLHSDEHFEEISASELDHPSVTPGDHQIDETRSLIMQSPSTPSSSIAGSLDTPEMSKRARFRKVTEKFSNWRKGGKKKDDDDFIGRRETIDTDSCADTGSLQSQDISNRDSPMASIQDVLSDVLPGLDGSPFISGLYFQPGNAYNEQTIRNAKMLGREIFCDLPSEQRVERINSQIDRIQTAIRETKDNRLSVMQNGGESSAKFQGLDERLQALAVVMLHYCSALQDCQSGRSTPAPPPDDDNQKREITEEISSVNVDSNNEEDSESVLDEDTVTGDVPVQHDHPLERPTKLDPSSDAVEAHS
ncbi:PDZ Domain containing [Caenorhabditis elegans]|uniref:PDZ Domain containing n=1 Tax=Caenorhabditis elegans TaxID=6239 RepID=Q18798_CAEEL|nr:PDZ Domain containing [Caenorhabditis elegans]CAA92456.3 PDZ Domain containing [Caenorhabditis elegans]|eukprot:NP_501558.2 Uncharacterized protein CELE_C53B4.4 [Caenorhabditis elegans]